MPLVLVVVGYLVQEKSVWSTEKKIVDNQICNIAAKEASQTMEYRANGFAVF